MNRNIIFGIFLLCNTCLFSQIVETGVLFDEISSIISDLPGEDGEEYEDPGVQDLETWEEVLENMWEGDYENAALEAAMINYDLVEFTDDNSGSVYYILRTNSTNYLGTYVYNPSYCRSLVVQSPHPRKDFNTGKQGVHVFEESEAMFFCLAGTNRCNQTIYSSCSGTTSVCGMSEDYRISDMAHSTTTVFQRTTDVLLNTFSNSYFISLHGFTKQDTDPYVILSNGTRDTPDPDYIDSLGNYLLMEDVMLTFKTAHLDLDWSRLVGFTNTQGRLINSSTDHCNTNASMTNGRFIHMEQEKSRLRDDIIGWTKVSEAVKNTFPCNIPVSTLEVDLSEEENLKIFPNPANDFLMLEGDFSQGQRVEVFNFLGQDFTEHILFKNKNTRLLELDISNCVAGIYFLKKGNQSLMFFKR